MTTTPEVVALSLLAAGMFATVAVANRFGLAHGTIRQAVLVSFGVMTLVFLGAAFVLLPDGLEAPAAALVYFATDGVLSVLAVIFLYIGAIRVGPSTAAAIKNTAPLPAIVLAALLLGEVPRGGIVVGAVLVVAGVVLLSAAPGAGVRRWRRDTLYPLAGAGIFAVDSLVRRVGVQQVEHALVAATIAGIVSVLVAVAWLGGTRGALPNARATAWFTIAGLAQAVGFLAMLTALQTGPIAVVIPLYTSSPIFVVIASRFVLGRFETITPTIVAGVVAVLVGIALVTVIGTA